MHTINVRKMLSSRSFKGLVVSANIVDRQPMIVINSDKRLRGQSSTEVMYAPPEGLVPPLLVIMIFGSFNVHAVESHMVYVKASSVTQQISVARGECPFVHSKIYKVNVGLRSIVGLQHLRPM